MRILFVLPAFFLLLLTLNGCSSKNDCSVDYWVATTGSDSGTGSEKDPFLTISHARDVVRADSSRGRCTINININEGTYRLSEPLALTSSDSGAEDAPVVYQAVSKNDVIISGAEQVTGWTLYDEANNIWKARVTTTLMPRQLYVNGTRAIRARTVDYPNYYYKTDTGYLYAYLEGEDPQIPPTWNNPTLVEAVTVTQWKMMRCPISEIIDHADVIMQTPCWLNVNVFPVPWNFQLLSWWENAYEFLNEPGEWYLDPTIQTLYYIPRDGENMHTADVELPILEKLVDVSGDSSSPINYITFDGLTFRYATWLEPNTAEGYALDQSGFRLLGADHKANLIGHDKYTVRTPGNLSFIYAQNINFENNTVEHMGSVGLDFGAGSQNNNIINNTFNDISSTAIQLGGNTYEDAHPSLESQYVRDNLISNNLIEYTGIEYYDAPGIYIGFTTRSTVEYNDINHTSWSGIAIGWGWGLLDPGGFAGVPDGTPNEWYTIDSPSEAQGNQILHNHITYFLEKLWDGGAIYSTGFQGSSSENGQLIAWNVAENKREAAGGNIFYTDGGSRYIILEGNVSLNNPQGTVDFGPCSKASSFEELLCLTTGVVPYGQDMGGCIPYGDLTFDTNYLRNALDFYDICENSHFPTAPYNMTFVDNVKVLSADEVPASIINEAGRQ